MSTQDTTQEQAARPGDAADGRAPRGVGHQDGNQGGAHRTPWAAAPGRPVHAPAEELEAVRAAATRVAGALDADALDRDRANAEPFTEVELLRDEGLLDVLVPAEHGGAGGHWESAFEAVRIVARADGSIAQLLAYHYVNQSSIAFYAPPAQQGQWWQRTREGGWLWGDAVNPTDPDVLLTPDGEHFRLSGFKRFATGSSVGEVIVVNALVTGEEREGEVLAFVVGRTREGVVLGGDWDNLGQRLTGSGSVRFEDVLVTERDILGPVTDLPISTLLTPGIQLAFGAFYLGVAEGALARGRELLLARRNAWFLSGADTYAKDPLFQRRIGEFKARVAAVAALAESRFRSYDEALALDTSLTAERRGEVAVGIAELKVVATHAALEVTSGIFDVTGSSSTANSVGLDRYWRNVRTHSLHDPVDYKAVEVGAHYLDGTTQPLSLYT